MLVISTAHADPSSGSHSSYATRNIQILREDIYGVISRGIRYSTLNPSVIMTGDFALALDGF